MDCKYYIQMGNKIAMVKSNKLESYIFNIPIKNNNFNVVAQIDNVYLTIKNYLTDTEMNIIEQSDEITMDELKKIIGENNE